MLKADPLCATANCVLGDIIQSFGWTFYDWI